MGTKDNFKPGTLIKTKYGKSDLIGGCFPKRFIWAYEDGEHLYRTRNPNLIGGIWGPKGYDWGTAGALTGFDPNHNYIINHEHFGEETLMVIKPPGFCEVPNFFRTARVIDDHKSAPLAYFSSIVLLRGKLWETPIVFFDIKDDTALWTKNALNDFIDNPNKLYSMFYTKCGVG